MSASQKAKIGRLIATLEKRGGDSIPIANAYRKILAAVARNDVVAYANAFNALADAMAKASPKTKAIVSEMLR